MTENMRTKAIITASAFTLLIAGLLFFLLERRTVPHETPGQSAFAGITLPANLEPEQIVLTVHGKIGKAEQAQFDLETIQAFQATSFTTFDPWDQKEQAYQGTPIIDVLEFLEVDDSAEYITVLAGNEYTVDIHLKDLRRYPYLFSYAMNGKLYKEYSGAQNKGPLAIAIDFSGTPEIDIETYKHQLVWLVETVTVK